MLLACQRVEINLSVQTGAQQGGLAGVAGVLCRALVPHQERRQQHLRHRVPLLWEQPVLHLPAVTLRTVVSLSH